jgi:putative aminopeptidase FrvX
MKKLFALCLTLSVLISANPAQKAHAADPLIITSAVSAGITTGIAISYTIAGSITDATADSLSQFKMEYLENVQSDAMEYIASEGEVVSTLLSNIIEASYQNIELQGLSISDVNELDLVHAIIKTARTQQL